MAVMMIEIICIPDEFGLSAAPQTMADGPGSRSSSEASLDGLLRPTVNAIGGESILTTGSIFAAGLARMQKVEERPLRSRSSSNCTTTPKGLAQLPREMDF